MHTMETRKNTSSFGSRKSLAEMVFRQYLRENGASWVTTMAGYETLRRALITFFEQHGNRQPRHFADVALFRVAEDLRTGERIENLNLHLLSVARTLLTEEWPGPLEDVDLTDSEVPLSEEWVQRCVQELPPEEYELLRKYYEIEGSDRKERRAELARKLGLTNEALLDRVLQIQARLEESIHDLNEKGML